MGVFQDLLGTVRSSFQLGIGGDRLTDSGLLVRAEPKAAARHWVAVGVVGLPVALIQLAVQVQSSKVFAAFITRPGRHGGRPLFG